MQNLDDQVTKLINTSEPKVAEVLKSRMDEVHRRFRGVEQTAKQHGGQLADLTDKLSEFEREVDQLENWELPLLETLESRRFMKETLPSVYNKLTVS